MLRDYVVHYRGRLVGVFRDYNEEGALKQAWQKAGYSASKYSSITKTDFVIQRVGLL